MSSDLRIVIRSLLRRDGPAALAKALRHAFSPKAWRWLRNQARDRRLMEASGLVDRDWYLREYPEVAEKGVDPVRDFLDPGHALRMPNPDFVPAEYAAVNYDVKACGFRPGVHWMLNGRRESRPVSFLECRPRPFPGGAVELRREFSAGPVVHRRTAIFASFSADGRIGDTVLHYLRGLREVADGILFIANCPVLPDEVAKLDGLVRLAVFRHHGCYDFGSYREGWREAKALGLLDPGVCDELIVCNDSCYGPVFPFPELFAEMARRREAAERPFDFWGLSLPRRYGRSFLPSYFYVFGPSVLEGPALDRWFERQEPYRDRGQVVVHCETRLTEHLIRSGHACGSLVPAAFNEGHREVPQKYPVTLLREYRDPLVKIKTLRGDSLESVEKAVALIREANPKLASLLPPVRDGEKGGAAGMRIAREARERHTVLLEETLADVRRRAKEGDAVRVRFLVLTLGGLPERVGFRGAFRDGRLVGSAVAVPDLRMAGAPARFQVLRTVRAALLRTLPVDAVVRVRPDADGEWPDATADADVVCWETAEDASDFRFNPHWAVGRRFLPVLFFDRRTAGPYPPDKEFARQNYAYFWKVFFSDRRDFDVYSAHSIRGAANAVLIESGDFIRALRDSLLPVVAPEETPRTPPFNDRDRNHHESEDTVR